MVIEVLGQLTGLFFNGAHQVDVVLCHQCDGHAVPACGRSACDLECATFTAARRSSSAGQRVLPALAVRPTLWM